MANYIAKTSQELIGSMEDYIKTICPRLSIDMPGDELREVTIKPTAREAANQYVWIEYLYLLQSIDGMRKLWRDADFQERLRYTLNGTQDDGLPTSRSTVLRMIENDIERRGRDFGLTRGGNQKATGTVKIFFRNDSSVSVPTGSKVYTRGTYSDPIEFETTTNISSQNPTYDASQGQYYLLLTIRAAQAGSNGNVIAGAISIPDSNITGAMRCYNTNATYNGRNKETIQHYLDRLGNYLTGTQIPQRGGYIKFAEDNDCVDCKVIMPGDTDCSSRPGRVDLWVQLYEEEVIINEKKKLDELVIEKPSYGPIQRVESVQLVNAETGSLLGTFSEGTDYSLSKDTSSGDAYSVRAGDQIEWKAGRGPSTGQAFRISFTVNKAAKTLQDLLNNGSSNDVVGDVLVRVSPRVLLNITVPQLKIFSGFTTEEVVTKIYSRLTSYFAGGSGYGGKYMGDDVSASDIIALIDNTNGVDRFDTDRMLLHRADDTAAYNDLIEIDTYEHAYIGTLYYSVPGGALVSWA
jgi:hypothetical protein